jgi:iron complex outermembrane receptor protein
MDWTRLPRAPRSRLRLPLCAAALLATLVVDRSAYADARTEARAFFKRGMTAIAAGKYEQGIEALQKAYETLPHPNVLFNIARAYVETGDLDNAIAYYKRYIDENPPDKDEVKAVVTQLQARLDRQRAALTAAQQAQPGVGTPGAPTGGSAAGASGGAASATPSGSTAAGGTEGPTSGGAAGAGAGGQAATSAGAATPGAGPRGTAEGLAVGGSKTEEVYEESVVTASRGAAQTPLESPNATTIITEQDIRLSGMTKIPELLRRTAGMDVMQTTSGWTETSIRGFNQRFSNKLIVLIDGRSVYTDMFGGTVWESLSIDVDQIERIEVVRGPGSALYGADAFAGVINVITKAPGEGKNSIRVGLGEELSTYGSLRATGRQGDFNYRVSAGYTYNPTWSLGYDLQRVDIDRTGEKPNLGSENIRMDARTTYRLGRDETIGIGGGFAKSNIDLFAIGALKEYTLPDFYTGDVTAFFNTKYIKTRAFYNYLRNEGGIGAAYNYKGVDQYRRYLAADTADIESVYADTFRTASVEHSVNVGLNYRLRQAQSAYVNGTQTEHHFGAFGQYSAKVGSIVTAILSGRVDRVPYNDRFEASPRASVLLHPNDKSTIRTTFSTAFRKSTFLEGFTQIPFQGPQGSVSSIVDTLRNGRIQPEGILTAELGYLNQMSEYFSVDVAAYYNRITDLVTLAPPTFLTPSQRLEGLGNFDALTGRFPVQYSAQVNQCVDYNVVGGELGARVFPVTGLDIFANYALNVVDPIRPPGCDIPSDQRTSVHKINAGVQVRTKPGFDGELSFHYSSPQVWVERDTDPVRGELVYRTLPLAEYTLLNARAGYRFLKNQMEVSVAAFNLLNVVHQQHPLTHFVSRRVMGFVQYTF